MSFSHSINLNIISLFPDMFDVLRFGVVRRALESQSIRLTHFNPRDYTHDKHRTIDDRPYGGGPGMVMLYQPLKDTVDAIKNKGPVIHLSPQGKPLEQADIKRLATLDSLTLLCSRYEGVDERFITTEVDEEYCVGDFVVSGGELPAMMLIDAIARLLPGTLNDQQSAEQDSFSDGLLDCPHYTRPEVVNGLKIPKVLQSGDHQAIKAFRDKEKLIRTWQRRSDLIKRRVLTDEERSVLDQIKGETNE
jgi:tRNA (guanine37-N1)-methyltransferase